MGDEMSELAYKPCSECGRTRRCEEHFVEQQDRIAELEAENTRLRDALQGLWARHNDGSEEHLWAEWDTAQDLLQSQDGK
jgi:hypothetical protein